MIFHRNDVTFIWFSTKPAAKVLQKMHIRKFLTKNYLQKQIDIYRKSKNGVNKCFFLRHTLGTCDMLTTDF